MGKRTEQMAYTRAAILAAAKQLFAERGFEGTTIRAIAGRASVGTGTVNLHFADKTSLLGEAIYGDIAAILRDLTTSTKTPLDIRLGEIVRPLFEYYARHPELSRILVKESLLLRGEWGERFDQQVRQFTKMMERVITSGQQRGELESGSPVSALVEAFLAYYIMLVIEGLRSGEPDPSELTARFQRLIRLHTRDIPPGAS